MTPTTIDAAKLFDLTDRRAIVMGVGALGRMAAETLTSAGASVLLVDSHQALEHQQTAALRQRFGAKVELFATAPSDQDGCAAMVAHVLDRLGGLDILVVTAGNNIARDAVEMTPEEWDTVMNGHVRVAWLATPAAAQAMIARGNGGKIVLTSSIRGRLGLPGYSAYVPAKHAINGLARTLACEWGRHRITVNAISSILFRSISPSGCFPMKSRAPACVTACSTNPARASCGTGRFRWCNAVSLRAGHPTSAPGMCSTWTEA